MLQVREGVDGGTRNRWKRSGLRMLSIQCQAISINLLSFVRLSIVLFFVRIYLHVLLDSFSNLHERLQCFGQPFFCLRSLEIFAQGLNKLHFEISIQYTRMCILIFCSDLRPGNFLPKNLIRSDTRKVGTPLL